MSKGILSFIEYILQGYNIPEATLKSLKKVKTVSIPVSKDIIIDIQENPLSAYYEIAYIYSCYKIETFGVIEINQLLNVFSLINADIFGCIEATQTISELSLSYEIIKYQ